MQRIMAAYLAAKTHADPSPSGMAARWKRHKFTRDHGGCMRTLNTDALGSAGSIIGGQAERGRRGGGGTDQYCWAGGVLLRVTVDDAFSATPGCVRTFSGSPSDCPTP